MVRAAREERGEEMVVEGSGVMKEGRGEKRVQEGSAEAQVWVVAVRLVESMAAGVAAGVAGVMAAGSSSRAPSLPRPAHPLAGVFRGHWHSTPTRWYLRLPPHLQECSRCRSTSLV